MKANYKIALLLSFVLFLWACSSDDDGNQIEIEGWLMEVNELRANTESYKDFNVAVNNGLVDVSGYVPNMGHHYLNPALSDGVFEMNKPEIILYVPDANGDMQMVGVEYSIIPADPDNPGSPPEGFTGDDDVWHFNEMIGQWQLHVWTILENPDGIFAPHNPVIGD